MNPTTPIASPATSRERPRLSLKDPRIPAALVPLLLVAFGCQPSWPRYPAGGIRNTLDEDATIRGSVRGERFDATLGPQSVLWIRDKGDEAARAEVFTGTGIEIDRHVRLTTYSQSHGYGRVDVDRHEILKTSMGLSVRRLPWERHNDRPSGQAGEYGPPDMRNDPFAP